MAPVHVPAGDAVPRRGTDARVHARLPRTAALRRARLPPAVRRRPRRCRRRSLARRRDLRRRPRSRRCWARPSVCTPRCPTGAKAVWVTELNWESAPQAPPACRRRCRRCGSRARCTACGSPASSLVDWQFLIDPYPGAARRHAHGRACRIPAPGRPLQRRPRRRPRTGAAQAVPAGLHSCRSTRCASTAARVRVWALLMRPGQRATLQRQGAAGLLADARAAARRSRRRAQRAGRAARRRAAAAAAAGRSLRPGRRSRAARRGRERAGLSAADPLRLGRRR